jgi:N-acetylglucosaminyl-diphospho-decaprenol L-rhamnosyltransferase
VSSRPKRADTPELPATADVSVVVVTYNALPYVERCLESVRGLETIVVDNGSSDGTVGLVRQRFPEVRVVEQENRGLAAGWNEGVRCAGGRYVLLLNADAWLEPGAADALVRFADEHPEAAVVGPRLLNVDGSLQRSVRGFPTVWRLATEYAFLRKLGPRTRLFNAFYGAGFEHDEVREAEFLMGACLLVRAAAIDEVGLADEDYFLFSEEVDWMYRFRRSGWKVLFFPGAEVTHVGGASHGGRMFREQIRGHLIFLLKHRGRREAERARRLLRWTLLVRGLLFRRERGRSYRDAARWLGSGDAAALSRR